MKEMGEEEKSRIAKQIEDLGESGLAEKERRLQNAVEENEVMLYGCRSMNTY
jgi:hypothetical protein